MYSESGDVPLPDIMEKIYEVKGGQAIDIKGFGSDEAMREFFATILPDFDREKVYNTDIRKLFTWYNQLIAAVLPSSKRKKSPKIRQPRQQKPPTKPLRNNTSPKIKIYPCSYHFEQG